MAVLDPNMPCPPPPPPRSYAILLWEIVTRNDITEFQPLAVSRQMGLLGRKTLVMPEDAPEVAKKIFDACTQMDPRARPTTTLIVEWLRTSE